MHSFFFLCVLSCSSRSVAFMAFMTRFCFSSMTQPPTTFYRWSKQQATFRRETWWRLCSQVSTSPLFCSLLFFSCKWHALLSYKCVPQSSYFLLLFPNHFFPSLVKLPLLCFAGGCIIKDNLLVYYLKCYCCRHFPSCFHPIHQPLLMKPHYRGTMVSLHPPWQWCVSLLSFSSGYHVWRFPD